MKRLFTVCLFVAARTCMFAQPAPPVSEAIASLQRDIPRLMDKAQVTGMSVALVRAGKLVYTGYFGYMSATEKKPVTERTIFEANSLSKPAFGYAVLQLVDAGKLNLDTPLNRYLQNPNEYSDDPRINLVTARLVLSHSSGLVSAGIRGSDKMTFAFDPGKKFRYSPDGITYLSLIVQRITGLSTEAFMAHYLLEPLGMRQSSYVWQQPYDSLRAYRHNWQGVTNPKRYPWEHGAACCSLQTTADDYATFVLAVLNDRLVGKKSWADMLSPQILVDSAHPGLFWGLGFGLEQAGASEYFWHWGDASTSKAYVTANVTTKDALIVFSNSENGLSFIKELLTDAIGGAHPGAAWLGYPRYDDPSWALLKSIVTQGAVTALKEDHLPVDEVSMNTIGYKLLAIEKMADAIVVFKQTVSDHPDSWNAWDSLGEAYMDNSDKAEAIRCYEKSLQLNPGNTNGTEQLKKLRGL
jgi:CubicO group peptidase (beta-lactamase class C family)